MLSSHVPSLKTVDVNKGEESYTNPSPRFQDSLLCRVISFALLAIGSNLGLRRDLQWSFWSVGIYRNKNKILLKRYAQCHACLIVVKPAPVT